MSENKDKSWRSLLKEMIVFEVIMSLLEFISDSIHVLYRLFIIALIIFATAAVAWHVFNP